VINTEILTSLLSDPELRGQISRLLTNKVRVDVKSLETSSLLSRQLFETALSAKQGQKVDNDGRLRRLIKEHLDFYELILEQTLNFNQHLSKQLQGLGVPPTAQNTVPTMSLNADFNSLARAPFVLENNRATPISIGFEITPFVTESGSAFVSAEVAFDPPRLELKPGQEGKIELVIAVAQGFEVGQAYYATITVKGLTGKQMLVRLQVGPEQLKPEIRVPTAEDLPPNSALTESESEHEHIPNGAKKSGTDTEAISAKKPKAKPAGGRRTSKREEN